LQLYCQSCSPNKSFTTNQSLWRLYSVITQQRQLTQTFFVYNKRLLPSLKRRQHFEWRARITLLYCQPTTFITQNNERPWLKKIKKKKRIDCIMINPHMIDFRNDMNNITQKKKKIQIKE
jgi:hypothetical protein